MACLLDGPRGLHEVALTAGLTGETLGIRDGEADRTHLRIDMSTAPSTFGTPPRLRVRPSRHRSRLLIFLPAMTLCWSCGGGATDVPEDAVGREEFIGAYLDLRTAALGSGATVLVKEVRDSILAAYDVTDQDLLDFVDSYGTDVEFMRDLWSDIESQLSERLEEMARDDANGDAEETQDGDAGVSP